jgi:type II secretory pathway predicted ATPase ExeA
MELLEEIRLLTNLETSSEKLVQIILSGQPELDVKLRQPELRQLRQRISLWCRTQPNTAEQTEAYIAQRLQIAGTQETLFTPEAVLAIQQASDGIPRLINLICEHALIFGYAEQLRVIPASVIDAVAEDLGLSTTAYATSYAQGEFLGATTFPNVQRSGSKVPLRQDR